MESSPIVKLLGGVEGGGDGHGGRGICGHPMLLSGIPNQPRPHTPSQPRWQDQQVAWRRPSTMPVTAATRAFILKAGGELQGEYKRTAGGPLPPLGQQPEPLVPHLDLQLQQQQPLPPHMRQRVGMCRGQRQPTPALPLRPQILLRRKQRLNAPGDGLKLHLEGGQPRVSADAASTVATEGT